MDYDLARGIIELQRERVENGTGVMSLHRADWKRLGNKTWLVRNKSNNDETPDTYGLRVFQKEIIEYSHSLVTLNDHGFFSRTTHDRFNEYLPRGFHVYGWTFAPVKRVLGFIQTPAGVYPYTMPVDFNYGGHHFAVDEVSYLPNNAPTLVQRLPAYVQTYLDRLFTDSPSPTHWASEDERGERCLRYGIYPRNLVYTAWLQANPLTNGSVGGGLSTVLEILFNNGSQPFRKQRTRADRAAYVEATLQHKGEIPEVNVTKLRRNLRDLLYNHILDDLGFDHVEWHRRD